MLTSSGKFLLRYPEPVTTASAARPISDPPATVAAIDEPPGRPPPRRSASVSPTRGARWAPPGALPRRSPVSTPTSWPARSRSPSARSARPSACAPRRQPRPGRGRGVGPVERVAEPRRVGRRGPAGTAYQAIGDHWRWFGRVVAERKVREGDPIVGLSSAPGRDRRGTRAPPGDPTSSRCRTGCRRSWSSSACSTAPSAWSAASSRGSWTGAAAAGRGPRRDVMRLVRLLEGLDDRRARSSSSLVAALADGWRSRATTLMSGVVRTLAR